MGQQPASGHGCPAPPPGGAVGLGTAKTADDWQKVAQRGILARGNDRDRNVDFPFSIGRPGCQPQGGIAHYHLSRQTFALRGCVTSRARPWAIASGPASTSMSTPRRCAETDDRASVGRCGAWLACGRGRAGLVRPGDEAQMAARTWRARRVQLRSDELTVQPHRQDVFARAWLASCI
jgi:hypothetical protein